MNDDTQDTMARLGQNIVRNSDTKVARVFSDHPPTGARIIAVQKNIQEHLKDRPEYVETTSEFNDVKSKLLAMHSRRAYQQAAPEPETRIFGTVATPAAAPGLRMAMV